MLSIHYLPLHQLVKEIIGQWEDKLLQDRFQVLYAYKAVKVLIEGHKDPLQIPIIALHLKIPIKPTFEIVLFNILSWCLVTDEVNHVYYIF